MPAYRRGAKGPEVAKIQERLKGLGFYLGPVDGDFGGGTEAAVRQFQQSKQLAVDGTVGPETWAALFAGAAIATPAIAEKPVAYRCLALTGAFETGNPAPECFAALTGDFDGQGISVGALQWNLGQGTLQPLLQEMDEAHPELLQDLFGDQYPTLKAVLQAERTEQLVWARTIQDPIRFIIHEPWRGQLKSLGRRQEFQDIQVAAAARLAQQAQDLCRRFGVQSERARALMFDIQVQNGGIGTVVSAQIQEDFQRLDSSGDPLALEVARLRIIANRRAEAANPRWIEDIRTRKLTIANGSGTVHGCYYDLEEQYGLTLTALP